MKLGYVLVALAIGCAYNPPAAPSKHPVKHDSSEVKPKPKHHDDHAKPKHKDHK